ncbi:hypothetical protein SRABI128_06439 [Microbacterium sp. Bi128]|nr:hypothetical protein SRABI128_06439 [Microbacterium sp. Bi128]
MSLTTTATASAAVPAVWAVATTCPTSWTEAPVHAPKISGPRPSGRASSGNTPIASVPHRVTSATGSTVSSCRIRRTAAIAPIADAPQMANPVATSSATRGGSRKSLLIPYVPAKAASTTAVTSRSAAQPRPSTSPRLTFRPSSTIPARMRCLPAKSSPGRAGPAVQPDTPGRLAASSPRSTAIVIAGSAGRSRWAATATATAAAAPARPGAASLRAEAVADLLGGTPLHCRTRP